VDVLLIYCDSGAPSRYLRCLEAGCYHQLLADSQLKVASVLLNADRPADSVVRGFREHAARLVCFDIDEFNVVPSLEFAAQLKSVFPDTPVCVFGVQTVLDPDAIVASKAVDYMIIGEGEVALYELVSHIVQHKDVSAIKNLWWRNKGALERNPLRPLQDNLDHLPFPDRSLLDQQPVVGPAGNEVLYVAASRGCPYECLFCYSPVLKRAYEGKGSYYRLRSPQQVVSEVHSEFHRRDFCRAVFVDEMFPCDKNWLRQFAQRMGGGRSIPFEVTVAAEKCDDEVLGILKTAGCSRIVLGIETGAEGLRRRIARRNLSSSGLLALVGKCRAMGIEVVATNLVGLPLETEELTQETYTFNQALSPDEIRCTVYQPIAGSPLSEYTHGKSRHPGQGAAGAALPDFTHLGAPVADLSPEVVRSHLYRFHFLNILQRIRALPTVECYYDFLRSLPNAKFRLRHVEAVDLGIAVRDGSPFGYMLTETSSDCRFAVQLHENSTLRFSILVPEASLSRIRLTPDRHYAAEVVWISGESEATVFYKALSASDGASSPRWQDCVVAIDPARLSGQVLFRVTSDPPSDSRVFVLWGMPVLLDAEQMFHGRDAGGGLAGEHSSKISDLELRLRDMSQMIEASRIAEQELRVERDEKVRRLAEIQIRMLDMEKEIEQLQAANDRLRAERDAGLAGRIKGIFKK
jgi:hypothetical protein